MLPTRLLAHIGLLAVGFGWTAPASGDTYFVVVSGKVTMEDGSPPPFTIGVERVCSDGQGSAPGPITNKKGEYTWRMEMDAFKSRSCVIRATHAGYASTGIDASAINATSHDTTVTLAPLVIFPAIPDPHGINGSDSNLPGKAKAPFKAAMKALDDRNNAEAGRQLEAAAEAAPKSAQIWHALGVVDEELDRPGEARKAYEHAIQADPKSLVDHVTLTRVCLKTKDWQCASQTADALIKADAKHFYPEIYIHRAVALYWLKDLAGAESSAQEAIRLDPAHKRPRAEYVLGRILEAKGDANGAKEHMANYLKLDRAPPDLDLIKQHLDNLGKPEAATVDPPLEVL